MSSNIIEWVASNYQDATITLDYNEGTRMYRVIVLMDHQKFLNNNRMKIIGCGKEIMEAFHDLVDNLTNYDRFYKNLVESNTMYTKVFETQTLEKEVNNGKTRENNSAREGLHIG